MSDKKDSFREFKGLQYNIRYVPRSEELAYKNGSIAPAVGYAGSKRPLLSKTIISFIKTGK